jgi:TRAP-type C4-dicarboxylate transport system permease small subunit
MSKSIRIRSLIFALLTRLLIVLTKIFALFVIAYLISFFGYYLDSNVTKGEHAKVFLMKFGAMYTAIFITGIFVALRFLSVIIDKGWSKFNS